MGPSNHRSSSCLLPPCLPPLILFVAPDRSALPLPSLLYGTREPNSLPLGAAVQLPLRPSPMTDATRPWRCPAALCSSPFVARSDAGPCLSHPNVDHERARLVWMEMARLPSNSIIGSTARLQGRINIDLTVVTEGVCNTSKSEYDYST